MPIYSELRPMTVDDRAAIEGLAPLLVTSRRWKMRRERGWILRALLVAGMAGVAFWTASWLVSVVVHTPAAELRMIRPLDPAAAVWPDIGLVVLLIAAAFGGAYQGMQWLRRVWWMRDPVSAALQRALDQNEVHEFHVAATGVVMPDNPGDHADGPWYLFDLGDASALLVHGPEFERSAEFPNTVFSYWRAPRGGAIVGMAIHGDRLVPDVSARFTVREEYRNSHDLVLEGPFEEVCERVLQRLPA